MESMVYICSPPGVETVTSSPILLPSMAEPTGETLDILPRSGFASFASTN